MSSQVFKYLSTHTWPEVFTLQKCPIQFSVDLTPMVLIDGLDFLLQKSSMVDTG